MFLNKTKIDYKKYDVSCYVIDKVRRVQKDKIQIHRQRASIHKEKNNASTFPRKLGIYY